MLNFYFTIGMKFNGNTPCSMAIHHASFNHHSCGHYTPMSFFLYIVPWSMWPYANQKNYNARLVSWHQTTTCLQPPSQLGSSKLNAMVSWEGSIGLVPPIIVEPTFKSETYEANSRMDCSPTFKRMDSKHNHLSKNGWFLKHLMFKHHFKVGFLFLLNSIIVCYKF